MATFAIWRLFAELGKPKRTLSNAGKHVLAMFLNS